LGYIVAILNKSSARKAPGASTCNSLRCLEPPGASYRSTKRITVHQFLETLFCACTRHFSRSGASSVPDLEVRHVPRPARAMCFTNIEASVETSTAPSKDPFVAGSRVVENEQEPTTTSNSRRASSWDRIATRFAYLWLAKDCSFADSKIHCLSKDCHG
jgi:hypothetical protein